MKTPKQDVSGLSPLASFAEDQARIVNGRIQSGNRNAVINQQTVSVERCFRRIAREKSGETLTLELVTLDGTIRVTMTKI